MDADIFNFHSSSDNGAKSFTAHFPDNSKPRRGEEIML